MNTNLEFAKKGGKGGKGGKKCVKCGKPSESCTC